MSRGALTSGGQTLVGFILGRALATRSLDKSARSTPTSADSSSTDTSPRPSRRSIPSRTSSRPWRTPSRANAAARSWSRPTGRSDTQAEAEHVISCARRGRNWRVFRRQAAEGRSGRDVPGSPQAGRYSSLTGAWCQGPGRGDPGSGENAAGRPDRWPVRRDPLVLQGVRPGRRAQCPLLPAVGPGTAAAAVPQRDQAPLPLRVIASARSGCSAG